MVAAVGEDHLRAVLAQPVADGAADKAVGPEDRHHVTGKRGATAPSPLHGRQVDIAGFDLICII